MRSPAKENAARERWVEVAIKRNFVTFISLVLLAFLMLGLFFAVRDKITDKIELPNEAVSEKILENGLVVLAKTVPSSEMVSINIALRAGSSLEGEYLGAGISHLVEHMVFKGTASRPAGEIEKEVKSYGGMINGSASSDMTDYHITLPAKYLSQGLSILKDMLLNSRFDENEFAKEKEVILKEIRLGNDEPQSKIYKLLNQTAYLQHPYKYPVIGYEKNLVALTRNDAFNYYNRMYVPNRMVISVVGGVESGKAIEMARREFADFRPANYNSIGLVVHAEDDQIMYRSAEEEAPINLAYLMMGFHSTGLLNRDLFAMDVLSMILGRGENSRLNSVLYKNKGLVHTVSCWNYTPGDPGLFTISAILDKENISSSEQAVMDEIEKMKKAGPSKKELETAKRMVIGDYIFSLQTIESQAGELSANYALSGAVDFSRRYVEGVQAVSREDVRRAANKYLEKNNLTTVRLVPAEIIKAAAPGLNTHKKDGTRKTVFDNGMVVLVHENASTPTVSVSIVMRGGLETEDERKNGLSNLVSNMMLKGTVLKKEDAIKGAVESRGGAISAFSGFNSFGLNIEMLKPDIRLNLDLAKEILTSSTFPQGELDKAKMLVFAAIKDEDDDIFKRGINYLRKIIFEGTPYALRQTGTFKSVSSLSREDLVKYYNAYCVPNNMVVSVSGDVDTDDVISKLRKSFGVLKKKELPDRPAKKAKISKIEIEKFEMDRDESLLLLGFEGVGVKDPDRYAIEVMVSILSGQSGRIFANLRSGQSLAYTLGCFQRSAIDAGYIAFYVATVKDKIDMSRAGLRSEIETLKENGVSDVELSAAKRELVSIQQVSMQMNAFCSFNSAVDELYGLGYDNIYRYANEIEKITVEDVKRAAAKYLTLDKYAEIVIYSKK